MTDEQKADLAVRPADISALPTDMDAQRRLGEWIFDEFGVDLTYAEAHAMLSARLADAVQPAAGEGGLRVAAERYMASVAALGQQSGYNHLSFFECPIIKAPDDVGEEAYRRWKELNDAGVALTAAVAASRAALSTSVPAGVVGSFQSRVKPWMDACFGPKISGDKVERNHRFLEEALELVQSTGCTASEAHQLVDYVFGRPVGEPQQESGGVSVTHAALCLAQGMDMDAAAEVELARIWTKVEKIRAKQTAKPKHSPLPEAPPAQEPTR